MLKRFFSLLTALLLTMGCAAAETAVARTSSSCPATISMTARPWRTISAACSDTLPDQPGQKRASLPMHEWAETLFGR